MKDKQAEIKKLHLQQRVTTNNLLSLD